MPLSLADIGVPRVIRRIGGDREVRKYLGSLGFVIGGEVAVVNMLGGNLIVRIKDSRVAVSGELARNIMV